MAKPKAVANPKTKDKAKPEAEAEETTKKKDDPAAAAAKNQLAIMLEKARASCGELAAEENDADEMA